MFCLSVVINESVSGSSSCRLAWLSPQVSGPHPFQSRCHWSQLHGLVSVLPLESYPLFQPVFYVCMLACFLIFTFSQSPHFARWGGGWSLPFSSPCNQHWHLYSRVSTHPLAPYHQPLSKLSGILNFLPNIRKLRISPLQSWSRTRMDLTMCESFKSQRSLLLRSMTFRASPMSLFPPSTTPLDWGC